MSSQPFEFSLPNVAAGPDPFSLDALPGDVDFVVLYLQRDYFCTNCRKQVRTLADRVDEFHERNAEVVSVLPEPVDRAEAWQDDYHLPYPLLADPDVEVGDAYDQRVRFSILGRFSDFFGRMPEVFVIDRRGDEPEIAWSYEGSSTFDRPDVEDVLAALDDLRDET